MSITVKEIAKDLNVSPATVDRAVHNRGRISPVTKKRVLRKIEGLGYKPNIFGRSLRLKKSFLIGVMVPDLSLSFYPRIIQGIENFLDRDGDGYGIILRTPHDEGSQMREAINCLLDKHVDGLAVCHSNFTRHDYQCFKEKHIPVVFLSHKIEGIKWPYVIVDNVLGGYLATEHLIEIGFKRIAFVGYWTGRMGEDRFLGYRRALKKYEIPFSKDMVIDKVERDTIEDLFKGNKDLAIFAPLDMVAARVISIAYDMGIHPPEDFVIVGFDDIPLASFIKPTLTTVAQPKLEMGRIAAVNLMKAIDGQRITNVVLKPKLVVRETTAIPVNRIERT